MRKFTLFIAFLFFVGMQIVQAQDREISGTVTSSDDDQPIPGVQVIVKGTSVGTITDLDGKYSFKVPESAKILIFQFVGMIAQEIEIGDQGEISLVMEPDILNIEGVVVTALGISREKKALGYSVQDVQGDEINKAGESNLVNSLQGRVAGVQITNASGGGIGSSARIVIRGNSSFGNNQPLFVVDGVPILNSSTEVSQWGNDYDYGASTTGNDFGNAAMDIDPDNVESISILKGANAAALYGSRAANGVILITTKKGHKGGQEAGRRIGVDFSTGLTFENPMSLPKYQNEYGQGYHGSKYLYDKFQEENPGVYNSYQEYAENESFTYYDGTGNGIQDGRDESWGPKLDDGLMLAQYNSPYTLDANGNPVFEQTPWESNPDNVKDFFETGNTWTTNLAMTGGTDRANGRVVLNHMKQKGMIPNTDLKRTNVGLNGTLNLTKKFSAGGNINYVKNTSDNLPGGGYDANNVMQSIGGWFGRQVDMKDLEENWETDNVWGNPYNWNTNYHNNPYWTANLNTTDRDRNRVYGNVWLKYNFTDWLNVMGRVGTDWYNEYRKHVIYDRSNENNLGGEFWQSQTFEQETNADLILNANKDWENWSMNISLGGNYRNYKNEFMWMRAPALTVPNLFTISNVSGDASSVMRYREKETNSIYASANVGYDRMIFLDLTARNDWSSTLPSDNWSYFYPSASLSFVFTEAFEIDEKILSFGKIRASWAQVGNDTDPYQTLGTYSQLNFTGGPINPFNGVSQFHYPYIIPPLDLKPEITSSFEAGVDLKFLNNRIGTDITYYTMSTKDQIMPVDISQASGFEQMLINAGKIENKGWEILLYAQIFKKKDGFNWDITFNWAKNTNEVIELYGDLEALQIGDSWGSTTIEARPGEEYGQIKGGAYVVDDDGNYIIDPGSGLPVHSSEPQIIGNILPDWFGGMRNTLAYKNISFSFLIDMRKGGDVFSVTHWFGAYSGVSVETTENNYREEGLSPDNNDILENGVYGYEYTDDNGNVLIQYTDAAGNDIDNPVATDQTVSAQDFFQDYWGLQEPSIIDGTFIKLREVVLTWQMPKKWFKNINWMNSADLSFVGRNLALLYVDESNKMRIDPETGFGTSNTGLGLEQYQLPSARSLGFKLHIAF